MFLQACLLGVNAVSVIPCTGGRTTERDLGFAGLSRMGRMGRRLCVTA